MADFISSLIAKVLVRVMARVPAKASEATKQMEPKNVAERVEYAPDHLPNTTVAKVNVLGEQLWGENLKEALERNPKTVFVIDDNWAFLISRSVALEGEQARQVAEVWRQLPPGIAAYCHIPAFGLEFITEAHSHTQASICWQCNNIFLVEDGKRTSYDFDGQSDMGQRLLELLKAHATKG